MILTDSDLKNEAKDKDIEDLDIFDFEEGGIKFDMIRFFRWVRYVGDKGVKVIKEYGEDEIKPFVSFTERQ